MGDELSERGTIRCWCAGFGPAASPSVVFGRRIRPYGLRPGHSPCWECLQYAVGYSRPPGTSPRKNHILERARDRSRTSTASQVLFILAWLKEDLP